MSQWAFTTRPGRSSRLRLWAKRTDAWHHAKDRQHGTRKGPPK